MMLDLKRYQADSPYPPVNNVRPDKALASKLMDAYSGESSELTTVLQYAYQSLKCRKKYNEIAEIIRGIFYVETLHLEFIGDCISKLGGDLQYTLALRERSISWQASLVAYDTSASKILLTNIQGEKYAAAFYEETSKAVDQPDIANLLARLAEDERLHIRIFSDLQHRFFR